MRVKTAPCPCCHGSGTKPDQADLGSQLRAQRESAGMSLRRMAVALDISAPYLSDLEHGRRSWSKDREMAYMEHVREWRQLNKP